ncbi:hypothetical protein [uncultured Mediterranean phage uvMED]|nr:hypothetical protein [uncultured Mediterranean phage uvMED]BAQ90332.1 hypothetical protein [uncultured Mediterranean phage uvMED]
MSELAKALCEYQRQTGGFEADKKGNRSQYASIGAVINNVKQANAFGLTFTQEVDFEDDTMFVRTVLMHVSGEARISRYPIYVDDKTNSQKIGGAITYAKRYALASMFGTEKGVEDSDDDGESNGLIDDAPKQVPPKPAATAPDQVSLIGVAGNSPGGGLKPAVGAFSDPAVVAAAPDDRVKETLAKVTDVKVLESAFRERGGMKQPDNIVKMFGNRKKELMNV